MTNSRTDAALARIAAALDRIEAASNRTAQSPDGTKLAALEQRNARLREEMGTALASIDQIIKQNQTVE